MQNYQNTDVFHRVWGNLIDLATGHTLELDAGETTTAGVAAWVYQTKVVDGETVPDFDKHMVEGDLPSDFEDEYLKPAAATVEVDAPKAVARAPKSDPVSTDGATTPDAPAPAGADKPKE